MGAPVTIHMDKSVGVRCAGRPEKRSARSFSTWLKTSASQTRKLPGTMKISILRGACTGSIGNGTAFVLPVEQAYRIRPGEVGEDTLQAPPGVLAAL